MDVRREIQALILELTRERNRLCDEVEQAEADETRAYPAYERGKSFGLSTALSGLSALERRLEAK